MASLFAWRVLYYEVGRTVRHDITEYEVSTQRPTTASPAECPVRAKAMQLATLPKRIKDELSEIEKTLENKIHGDTLFILANIVYMDKVVWQRRFGKKKSRPVKLQIRTFRHNRVPRCQCHQGFNGVDAVQTLPRQKGSITRRSVQKLHARIFN